MDKEEKVSGFEEPAAQAGDGVRRGRRTTSRESNRRTADETRRDRVESEWEEKIIQVRRVTKVVKGGKKLSFRAVVAVGNGKGQVGIGVGKAAEVISAIQKGVVDAKKSLVSVPLVGTTIPHQIVGKTGSSRILLKPAAKGTGVIAGGAARAIGLHPHRQRHRRAAGHCAAPVTVKDPNVAQPRRQELKPPAQLGHRHRVVSVVD